MLVSAIIALTRVFKAISDDPWWLVHWWRFDGGADDPWWRVYWWRFGGGEMTLGGEFTGGEVTINRPKLQ